MGDITEHNLPNETMERSRRIMESVIDISPAVIYIFDIRHRRNVFSNSSAATALGYAQWQVDADGFISSVMHPEHWNPFLDYLRRLAGLRDEESADFECRMRHNNSTWRWFHSRDKVFTRNADGSVREIIGTATDITERKIAEEKNRFIVDLDEALLPLADPKRMIAVAMRMLGERMRVDWCDYADVEADEDHFVVIGEYTRGAPPGIVGRYRMSEFSERERQILRADCPYVVNDIDAELPEGAALSLYCGGRMRSLVSVPLTRDRNLVARMALYQNLPRRWLDEEIDLITTVANRCWDSIERASALKRFKDSDERYRAFIANSSEGIWRYELDEPIPVTLSEEEQIGLFYKRGYIAECNEVFGRTHGYSSADQILGWRVGGLLVQLEPDRVNAYAQAFVRSGYRLIGAESREVDIYGNTKYFLSNLIGIQENGTLIRVWGTQRDITEQKRAEKEREYLLLKEKAARQDAESANRVKDEFLATISHELRTPLTAILGWARMLAEGAVPEPQMQHAFEVIQHRAEMQGRLINDILDTARIITGKFNLEARPIEVGRILQAAVDAVRPSAEVKGITLEVLNANQSSTILGDASRVQQIFWNLFSNALKFTNKGGRIEARLSRIGDRIEVSISDNGIGADPRILPYLFDRFRQADSSSTRKYGGLGLGLALVRHLAEVHGGSVSASSPGIGLGSTFKVDFPAAPMPCLPQPESVHPKPESKPTVEGRPADSFRDLKGLRVLVVEDDPETLDLLKFILDRCQVDVTTAASAVEALRVLESSQADVLVSDLAMAHQDGYDLIRHVRRLAPECGGNIPAVALSAYTRDEDRTRALAAGFHLHLAKPVDPNELVVALARLAGRRT